jgi:hypothetical protein
VKGGIERAVLDLQHFVAGALNVFGDGVPVSGAEEQSAEDEHVQGSLEELDAIGVLFGHGRESTL